MGETIGKGTTADVFSGVNIETKEKVAIKTQISYSSDDFPEEDDIRAEYGVYKKLEGVKGIPTVFGIYLSSHRCHHSDDGECYSIVMERLDQNLDEFRRSKSRLSLDTTLRLTIDLINCVEQVHRKGYVHSNIRITNVMIRKDQIYLIGFGRAKKIIHPKPTKDNADDSTSSHTTLASRRDDLQAVFMVLHDLLCDMYPRVPRSQHRWRRCQDKLQRKTPYIQQFLQNNYPELEVCFKRIKSLTVDETPNYDLFRGILETMRGRKESGNCGREAKTAVV